MISNPKPELSDFNPPAGQRTVSIIIPVRNGGHAIATLLDRLESLPMPNGWKKQVIVGYQHSTDDTLKILKSRNVRIVCNSRIGPSANRNAAVAKSDGELLYFIDADACPVGRSFMFRLIETAEALGDYGACGGPILMDSSQSGNAVAVADHLASWFAWHPHRPSGPSFFQPSVNLLMPRRVYDAAGGFDETLFVLEDFDLLHRIKACGWKIYFVNCLAVTHLARADLAASWRHSWRWGLPVREQFYLKLAQSRFAFLTRPKLFRLNLPVIFLSRFRQVWRQSWKHSPRQTLRCAPLLAATVFVWSAAVALGSKPSSGNLI